MVSDARFSDNKNVNVIQTYNNQEYTLARLSIWEAIAVWFEKETSKKFTERCINEVYRIWLHEFA